MSSLMDQGRNMALFIRVFHVLLGAVLAYAGYQYTQGVKLPASFYNILVVLGSLAVLYHGFKLLQLLNIVN